MRKHCRRTHRREAAPTLVAYYLNPEVSKARAAYRGRPASSEQSAEHIVSGPNVDSDGKNHKSGFEAVEHFIEHGTKSERKGTTDTLGNPLIMPVGGFPILEIGAQGGAA